MAQQNPATPAPHPTHPLPLSAIVPPLVLGGAGFSNQLHPDPESLPAVAIVKRALDLGIRAIDTSPYYGNSETILGTALAHPSIASPFPREHLVLMTKVGRVAADRFDYSPAGVRASVARSLHRFRTGYLDVVFCHDAEFVSDDEVVAAVETLLELRAEGKVKHVGISGYPIPTLARLAQRVRQRCGRPLDAVQVWAQLTLQNERLRSEGLEAFEKAGVDCVFASSPLAVGLLREGGVPVGQLGDWHPAPQGLREAARRAAEFVRRRGGSLAEVALRFAVKGACEAEGRRVHVRTIFGAGSLAELEENVRVAMSELEMQGKGETGVDAGLVEGVRNILGEWADYSLENKE